MQLAGVRRQLGEARAALVDSVAHATHGACDPAYRAALRSRNLLFHAARGLAAARGEELPEMPVVGIPGGGLDDHRAVLAAIDAALVVTDDRTMVDALAPARTPCARYLGWLRDEVGRALTGR
ncbi:MAG: hypothetical protein EXR72_10970 [Myxococcales bacterium]|nr:hypothetical protein [Myxococcales bacterium]